MVSFTNAVQATATVSNLLQSTTKPSNIYRPEDPLSSTAVDYAVSSINTAAQATESYYNQNVNSEISTIITLSNEAENGTRPDSTENNYYKTGQFLLTQKSNPILSEDDERYNTDFHGIFYQYGAGTENSSFGHGINIKNSPVFFVKDDDLAYKNIKENLSNGSISTNYNTQTFRVSGQEFNPNGTEKIQKYIVQHSGSYIGNLTLTSEEIASGATKAVELRSDINIYYTYDNITYEQQTWSTKYRIALNNNNEEKSITIREQNNLKLYNKYERKYEVSANVRSTSATIADGYNKINTTVSMDKIQYFDVSENDKDASQIAYLSKRVSDTTKQLDAVDTPGSSINSTVYTTRSLLLQKASPTVNYSYDIVGGSTYETALQTALSEQGSMSTSHVDRGGSFSIDVLNGTGTARAVGTTTSLLYDRSTNSGSYKVGAGGVEVSNINSLHPLQFSADAQYASKTFRRSDIPTLASTFGDNRISGSSDFSSITLTSPVASTLRGTVESTHIISLTNRTANLSATGFRSVGTGIVQIGSFSGVGDNVYGTGPYGSIAGNYVSTPTISVHSMNTSNFLPENGYTMTTNEGRGPFHIVNKKLYFYKTHSTDTNKYVRILT